MKPVAAYLVLFMALTLSLSGQSLPLDTIRIKEVRISAGIDPSSIFPFTKTSVDSSLKRSYSLSSVAELLSENNLLYIKSYGPGGIASPSFRGTGASHTTVTWNGININNPMPGQSDLSLLPSGLADDISITGGGSSLLSDGGAIGGLITLETKSDWKEGCSLSLNTGTASFGRYSGLAALRAGNSKVSSVTRAYFNSSENNFPFINNAMAAEPFTDKRKNSETHTKGFLQELYLKGINSTASARVWYNATERNIPVPMISRQPIPGEKQTDRSFRGLLGYRLSLPDADIKADAAFVADRLLYSNPETSTDSRNLVRTITMKTEISPKLGEKTKLSILASHEINIVNSNNYTGRRNRNTSIIAVKAARSFMSSVGTSALLRGKLTDGKVINPDFAAGLEYHLPAAPGLIVKTNMAANSKQPGMNDMYWLPGGNPALKSEYGLSGELGLGYTGRADQNPALNASLTAFGNRIHNMIHWYPGESGYWSAVNLGRVRIKGAELTAGADYVKDEFSLEISGSYSFTRASETTDSEPDPDRNQLVYIPVHQANASLRAGYGILRASFNPSFTGRRYLSADNSDYLPGYLLCDLSAGVLRETKKVNIDLGIKISNLFNIDYQAVAWHPMPGRSYAINLLIEFKN